MIQSIATRSLPEEEILYKRKRVTVTPSWLEVKNTSYSIRYIQKLSLKSLSPPRITAGIIFVLAAVLTGWQVYRMNTQELPLGIAWSMLALCLLLLFASSFVAFVMRSRYRLDIKFSNEDKLLQIIRPTRADILVLHEALSLAMDWYKSERGAVSIDADEPLELQADA